MKVRSGRSRVAPFAGQALLIAAALIATAMSSSVVSAQVPVSVDSSRQRRPFDHQRHERLSCVSCHGTGDAHRTIKVQTARDCASCHHDPARAQSCSTCHGSDLPNAKPILTNLRFTVWDSARDRALSFSHNIHTILNCLDCHDTPVTLARSRDCTSCHKDHHRVQATCTNCHQPVRPSVHRETVHLSCAGSGCHASEVTPPPTQSRTLCLYCHQRQTLHEPGRICSECHRLQHAAARHQTGIRVAVKR
jgi:hypothetical protein